MSRKPNALLLAVALGATLIGAACGGGGGGKGDKAAFCLDNATLNTKAEKAKSLSDIVTIFKANKATIDDFGKQAPSEIKADAKALVEAANKVISTGNAQAFGDSAVSAAGKRVDKYCGQGT
jgi:hypothetical protein